MNVILQPVHLLLYMSLIGAASDLVSRNPIYALVAIGFLIPAEKFIKNMFGLNKASSTSDFGSFAKNALAYEGLKKLGSAVSSKGGKGSSSIKGTSSNDNDVETSRFNKIRRPELGSYTANTGDSDKVKNNNKPSLLENNEQKENQNEKNIGNEPINQADWIAQQKQENLDKGIELPDSYYQRGAEQWNKDKVEEDRIKQLENPEQPEQIAQQRLAQEQQDKAKININSSDKPKSAQKGSKKKIAGRVGKAALKGGKTAFKTALKGAKVGAKVGLRAGLAAGGATIGLASVIGTGDVSNLAKFTLAGAAAGGQIGKGATNLVENVANSGIQAIRGGIDTISDVYNEEKYGTSVAKEKKDKKLNERERKRFLNDKNEIKKYKKMKSDIGYDGDVNDLMNVAADYKEAGVSDDMIKNALKVEQKRDNTIGGDSHNKMIDVASFATENGYKKSDILSNKSRSDMEDVVETAIAEKDRYEVMKNIADLYGAGDFYSKNSRFKQPTSNSKVIDSGKSPNKKN